jgi:hypothetical protein
VFQRRLRFYTGAAHFTVIGSLTEAGLEEADMVCGLIT